jgi:branched-chain amino acid transport system substrate-binding protein
MRAGGNSASRATRMLGLLAAGSALLLTACGGATSASSSTGTHEGLPKEVHVVSINPTTGPVAFAGLGANKGYELAVKQINKERFLGDTTLRLSLADTKSEAQTAAQEMSSGIADKGITAVFGSVACTEAAAMSALAQRQGLPVVYTQAGCDGVVIGDYTYRATPFMRDYYPILKKFIKDQGAKTLGIIYTEAFPALQDIGGKTLPRMAKELGITVTKSIGTSITTVDFAAPIAQVLKTKPDLVAILQAGASNATAMKELRQAGYAGPVLGNAGAGAGSLAPAGSDGAGMVWATDFSPHQSAASSQKFVEAYRAEYGEDPLNYAAEAYDAAWFLARSIKEADSVDRAAVKDAMAIVAKRPFDGALGSELSWSERQLDVPGVVVEWDGKGERLLYEAAQQ